MRVLYRFFIALALNSDFIGLQAQDLNLVTAVLVAFALLVPAYKRKLAGFGRRAAQIVAHRRQGGLIMLLAQGLEITFNPGTPIENRVLRGLDLTIPTGQFVTVIGCNGAGKSTFLNAVSGDLMVDRGTHPHRRPGRDAQAAPGSAATWWHACSRTRWPAPARR